MRALNRVTSCWLTGIVVLYLSGCSGLFFYPQKHMAVSPAVEQFSPQDIFFTTADGLTLHGWFMLSPDPQGTVLVFHGNAENLGTHVNGVLWLVREGFNVFIVDYRGYGRAEGTPTIEGVMADGAAALAEVFKLPGADPERVAVLGQSLGGAVAIHAVATSPRKGNVKALVVESTFAGFRSIAREKLGSFFLTWPFQYPLSWLFDDDFSPQDWISQVSPVPVLIIQGRDDPVVPLGHGRILYEAARPPKALWETEPPGHVRSFADAGVRGRLAGFLRDSFRPPKAGDIVLPVDKPE